MNEEIMAEDCEGRSSPTSETETLHAEFKDGQLQIVEVTPFSTGDDDDDDEYVETVHMEAEPGGCNYVQVFDIDGEQVVQLDLMNLTLVKCNNKDDNEATYKLVTEEIPDDDNVFDDDETIFLRTDSDNAENRDPTTSKYMVLVDDPGEGPVYNVTQPVTNTKHNKHVEKKPKTVAELLEKKKAFEKAKKLLSYTMKRSKRGRPATLPVPGPDEMLSSPNFKLYLYQCKMCSFKCNAAKELTQHKKTEHTDRRTANITCKQQIPNGVARAHRKEDKSTCLFECTKCQFKGNSSVQLMRHVQEHHLKKDPQIETAPEPLETIESLEEELDDIFECGACGFQTSCTDEFTEHAALVHNAHVNLTGPELSFVQ